MRSSKTPGMISPAVGCGSSAAIACAAASFMPSLIRDARTSRAPRKTPGNASTLLIWFGWSLRPVATTSAYRAATTGSTSGSGLASARMIARSASRPRATSGTVPPLTPTYTSASTSAAARSPVTPRGFVVRVSRRLCSARSVRPVWTIPRLSQTMTSAIPARRRIPATATPAAPAPLTTTRSVVSALPTTTAALVRAARTTIAVPCWSSWNTGMRSRSCSRRSTSKQRGAEMSSRLIPPYVGASRAIVSTSSSTSVVSRQIGTASTSAKCLNSTALPSITGSAAAGPMSPRPSTAVPSLMTATVLAREV